MSSSCAIHYCCVSLLLSVPPSLDVDFVFFFNASATTEIYTLSLHDALPILTGQGSTNDVTIKNDADADVIEIPTGTQQVVFDEIGRAHV